MKQLLLYAPLSWTLQNYLICNRMSETRLRMDK